MWVIFIPVPLVMLHRSHGAPDKRGLDEPALLLREGEGTTESERERERERKIVSIHFMKKRI